MSKKRHAFAKITSLTKLPDDLDKEELKPLSQPALSELRSLIKEAMIPLLIQVFQLRQKNLEAPAFGPGASTQESEATKKLLSLKQDLTHLSLWCTSCLTQIEKALSSPVSENATECATSKKGTRIKLAKIQQEKTHPTSSLIRRVFSLAFRRNPHS